MQLISGNDQNQNISVVTMINGDASQTKTFSPSSNNMANVLRSLICDNNGIVIAQNVYRCMICATICESIDDVHQHYQLEHIENDVDCFDVIEDGDNEIESNQFVPKRIDYDNDDFDETSSLESSPLLFPIQHQQVPTLLPSNFSQEFINEQIENNNDKVIEEDDEIPFQSLKNFSQNFDVQDFLISSPISPEIGETSIMEYLNNSNQPFPNLTPFNQNKTNSSSGGLLTCEVCGSIKFYSHISRRYGVFSCEGCAKFFYRYCQKPVNYNCLRSQGENNSRGRTKCSLKITDQTNGSRCKACLLQACLRKYHLDPKKHAKIFEISNQHRRLQNQTLNDDGSIMDNNNNSNQLIFPCDDGDALTNDNLDEDQKFSLPFEMMTNLKKSTKTISNEHASNRHNVISLTGKSAKNSKSLIFNDNRTSLLNKKKQSSTTTTTVHNEMIKVKSSRNRRASCRKCKGCLAEDCGSCLYCLDKPKFGGNDVKKQKCLRRRCLRLN